MARRPGKKYPLIIYRHIVSRWWFAMIFMGLGLFALAYIEYIKPAAEFNALPWQVFAGVGMLAILAGIFFFAIRFMAYVQPHPAFLKFVTPFLRINISYRRIRRTTTTEMRQLFPLKSVSGWGRDVLSPLASKTALVLELNGYPVSPMILRLFLSRFFFKDKTPHLVILVEDWLKFSSEMESMRTGVEPPDEPRKPKNSILSRLPRQ
ncbi:MAG TPA: hypothetical protein PKK96_12985 [Anaerolineales bacterium]|nr:hypothetical protein [Anaerolineales bacterium]HMR99444.1 hypothetical protein [Anaerolineales bacterium]HNQ94274.1 hypothetical protein [Anaerolineales bacterium]HNS61915.1 hypothetical protein [Anaerolineales bacterium]